MAANTLSPPVIWMAALGTATGILSSIRLGPLANIEILEVPVQQGLLFGLVIAYGAHRWGGTRWTGTLITISAVLAAWITAYTGFRILTGSGFNTYQAGIAAGAIGAFGTILATAIAIPTLRSRQAVKKYWLSTTATGAILGPLAIFAMQGGDAYLLLLFVPWQALVAASIGYALDVDLQDVVHFFP